VAAYLGLDGFRWGWVAALIDDEGNQSFDYASTLQRLLSIPHDRAMIDIPIGLPDRGFRSCDIEARDRLGSSVFTGARRNLFTFPNLPAANRHYWHYEGERKGISCQLWNLRCKIKEVDEIITPDRQRVFSETHPELIFWSRNDENALAGKKTKAGRKQRVRILHKLGFRHVERWLKLRFGTGIGCDDLIDACACAIAARDSTRALGDRKPDARGLFMQMHYY